MDTGGRRVVSGGGRGLRGGLSKWRGHCGWVAMAVVAGTLAAWSAPAAACPSCKMAYAPRNVDTGAAQRPRGDPARAYAVSIVGMLAVLALVVGGLIRVMVHAVREEEAAANASSRSAAPGPAS